MELICVVLGSPTSKERFGAASKLLDYGFANYALASFGRSEGYPSVKVLKGEKGYVALELSEDANFLVKKGDKNKIEKKVDARGEATAPIEKGTKLGEVTFYLGGEELSKRDLVARDAIPRITFFEMLKKMFSNWVLHGA
jgi:D-alanyl-D-alanine carboxypeptidase (penicillin-binding protein 5/6)